MLEHYSGMKCSSTRIGIEFIGIIKVLVVRFLSHMHMAIMYTYLNYLHLKGVF